MQFVKAFTANSHAWNSAAVQLVYLSVGHIHVQLNDIV